MRFKACNKILSQVELRRKNFDDLCGECVKYSSDNTTTFKDPQHLLTTMMYFDGEVTKPRKGRD